jgi:hypothetical protein
MKFFELIVDYGFVVLLLAPGFKQFRGIPIERWLWFAIPEALIGIMIIAYMRRATDQPTHRRRFRIVGVALLCVFVFHQYLYKL